MLRLRHASMMLALFVPAVRALPPPSAAEVMGLVKLADRPRGTTVYDAGGGVMGQITETSDAMVTIATARGTVRMPANALHPSPLGPVTSVSAAELDAMTATIKRAAASTASAPVK